MHGAGGKRGANVKAKTTHKTKQRNGQAIEKRGDMFLFTKGETRSPENK